MRIRPRWGVACLALAHIAAIGGSFGQDKSPKGDLDNGKKVFDSRCFECHNADSKEKKVGPGFKGVKDGRLPSGGKATRETLLQVIDDGAGEMMPPFKELLTDSEKEDVIAYVLTR
jgi:mono/diheme cytochrome c family protein